VDVSDDGSIRVVGRSVQSMSRAKAKILGLITVPKVGTIYRDCRVKNVTSFGCFVEIFPGKEVCEFLFTKTYFVAIALFLSSTALQHHVNSL
jgi:polyribonucleotide nucleotidyltransferase